MVAVRARSTFVTAAFALAFACTAAAYPDGMEMSRRGLPAKGPAAPAVPAGHALYVGAADDAAQHVDPMVSKAKMTLARLAGFNAVRLTSIWEPGRTAPPPTQLLRLRNAVNAAALDGIRVVVSVYHFGSRTTPLTAEARAQFAEYAASLARSLPQVTDFIVGNEPNLNRFWMPQFNSDGTSASPAAYLALLAETYDALKAVSPRVTVIGGSVSPRGEDKHTSTRHTHSPTRFIPELGKAYRASGRTRPVMDQFAFHPYLFGHQPPNSTHARTTTVALNDYPKLVGLLGQAFDGTAQPGSRLPVVYDEFGYESVIPAERSELYEGAEPATIRTLDDTTMAAWYRQALEIATCQPTVKGFLFFLVADETQRAGWQSGVYYADDTPKPYLAAVKAAAVAARSGKLVPSCPVP
jgi:Cellulase (glycosyl hydrolase family 5)